MGKAFAGVAAVVVGGVSGDQNLRDAGIEGLTATQEENKGALVLLATMGRAKTSVGTSAEIGGAVSRSGPKGVDPKHHNANVLIKDAKGNVIVHDRLVSGNMTPSEKALGFPKKLFSVSH